MTKYEAGFTVEGNRAVIQYFERKPEGLVLTEEVIYINEGYDFTDIMTSTTKPTEYEIDAIEADLTRSLVHGDRLKWFSRFYRNV